MGSRNVTSQSESHDLLQRVIEGDNDARQELFSQYEVRLKAMIRLRLHRGLRGRLDPSDVVQEAYIDVVKRLDECLKKPPESFFPLDSQSDCHKAGRDSPSSSRCPGP